MRLRWDGPKISPTPAGKVKDVAESFLYGFLFFGAIGIAFMIIGAIANALWPSTKTCITTDNLGHCTYYYEAPAIDKDGQTR